MKEIFLGLFLGLCLHFGIQGYQIYQASPCKHIEWDLPAFKAACFTQQSYRWNQ